MKTLNDLSGFCDHLVGKFGSPGDCTEDQKADEFRRIYLRDLPVNLRSLRAIATCLGIRLKGLETMPRNLRGYHEICDDRKCLYYRHDDTASGIQNTILHELREMMETMFVEAYPTYKPLRTSARHIAANRFASAVLLPEDEFRANVFKTGFDVIRLSRGYSKSCSQVLLRMGEVLRGRLFFYGSLYEPDDADGNDWAVTYWTGSNNDDADSNVYGLDGLFPRRGRKALAGSLIGLTVKTGRPHLVGRITLTDENEYFDGGLTALAQPLTGRSRQVEKVAMVALMIQDSHLFDTQIDKINPVKLERFHRHF
ncbi:ImmA/IrrE family metallo-endopeptidase [Dehalogenimonas sp. THU2]|uniref:ImmA/IrrE family metallo-endopeptidase n=1 Tax=Dehalogenimonas sp. THU2 TaxID=3151121 RepID=UPI0032186825